MDQSVQLQILVMRERSTTTIQMSLGKGEDLLQKLKSNKEYVNSNNNSSSNNNNNSSNNNSNNNNNNNNNGIENPHTRVIP